MQYAEMKRLDAEALDITRQLGCQQCMAGIASSSTQDASSSDSSSSNHDTMTPAELAVYQTLHTPQPWPADVAAAAVTGVCVCACC